MKENKEKQINPEERSAKGIRKLLFWLALLGIIFVFGMMLTENSEKSEPNCIEVEMYQQQIDNDTSIVVDPLTSPNGMYSKEAPGANGTHVMDKAWRGDDTITSNKEVDTDDLKDFQEIMEPDKK